MTIKHYHLFDASVSKDAFKEAKLDSPESWDMLRTSEPLFSIPQEREAWLRVNEEQIRKDGQDAKLKERGADIARLLKERNITSVFATGSGGAGLEYHILKNAPGLHMLCSDYAPQTVEILRKVFVEAESVVQFDILRDAWTPVTNRSDTSTTLCLMYRLDAGFTDLEWRSIFKRLKDEGVQQILYIPTGFLTMRGLLFRLRSRLLWMLSGKHAVFSGYLRTKDTFLSFWRGYFSSTEYVLGGMAGFWLTLEK